jgi:signal transduction histidine kinase
VLKRWPWRTITFRLTALYGLVFAAGIVVLLGVVYVSTADYLTRRWDDALRTEARRLERAGPAAVLRMFGPETARDPLMRFALYSQTGQRIAGDSPLDAMALPIDGAPRDVRGARRATSSRVLVERTPWGEILLIERDSRPIVELRRIILTALIWSGAIIAAVGLAMGSLLSLGPLARIRRIQAASRAVAAGDLGLRLPVSSAGDEIDELAAIANVMMDEAERLLIQARTVGEGVAHELRSPLTRLRARLEHAAQDLAEGDPRRKLLASCVAEADTVLARFGALLRIAALESRARRSGLAPVTLGELAAQLHDLYAPLAADLGLALDVEATQGLIIEADPALLFEALANLVDNALKFTPAGGRVRVSFRAAGEGAMLEVADDGPGIAPAERPLVTRRFYRSARHAGVEGHGLGLSLVAAVADLHGFILSFDDAKPGVIARLTCPAYPS